MSRLEYLRPKTIEEASALMYRGVPLGGGTSLTPNRRELKAVIDLRDLGLAGIDLEDDLIKIGPMTKLQSMAESSVLPATLREVCCLEAGWNLRNQISLAGVIMVSEARSALLTVLLALNTRVVQVPGKLSSDLDALLNDRENVKLITEIRFETPVALRYEQVSRTPADFPMVSAAAAEFVSEKRKMFNVALGGFGRRPILLKVRPTEIENKGQLEAFVESASRAYRHAEDAWASAEYRSAIAGVLVGRLLSSGAS